MTLFRKVAHIHLPTMLLVSASLMAAPSDSGIDPSQLRLNVPQPTQRVIAVNSQEKAKYPSRFQRARCTPGFSCRGATGTSFQFDKNKAIKFALVLGASS
jgi:hypothetical protein